MKTGQRPSLRLHQESESLDDQLDRLNLALETMIQPLDSHEGGVESPCVLRKRVCSMEPSRLFEDEFSETMSRVTLEEEQFLSRIDCLAYSLERTIMVNEDFRSFEYRKQGKSG